MYVSHAGADDIAHAPCRSVRLGTPRNSSLPGLLNKLLFTVLYGTIPLGPRFIWVSAHDEQFYFHS